MLAPGATILCTGMRPASLGCFAYRLSKRNVLYAVIAAHAARANEKVIFGNGTFLGVVKEINRALDSALVEVAHGVNLNLTEANFQIDGVNAALSGLFPFSSYWDLIDRCRTQRQQTWWANQVKIPVMHSGQKSNRVNPPVTSKKSAEKGAVPFGDKPSNMVTMYERTSRAGDSGGPVFDAAHRLVGFISMGGSAVDSKQTMITVAERVFAKFDLTLATWQNRDDWQADPFGDVAVDEWG